jgi:hypothetical protein
MPVSEEFTKSMINDGPPRTDSRNTLTLFNQRIVQHNIGSSHDASC